MDDIDIDSVTRMLGRDRDQEVNGLHHEAIDRAAHAALLSTDEVGRLVASPQVREAIDEWRRATDSWETTRNQYLDLLGNTTDYEELDYRENMSSIAYDRIVDSHSRMDEVAAEATGNPAAGERLRIFVAAGEPLMEQADSQELRGVLHLNHALEVGQEQAEARLPRGQEPSAELQAEGEEHLAAAKQALAQRPDADGVLAVVQDLAAHPHSREWHGNDDMDTPIYKELGQAIEATGLGDKETLSRLQQQRTFNAEHLQLDGYTAGKPLPLEAPPAPSATREPAASVGRDMAPAVAVDRGAEKDIVDAVAAGERRARARLPHNERPSEELVEIGWEYVQEALMQLSEHPGREQFLKIVEDLAAHPWSENWRDPSTAIHRALGEAFETAGFADGDRDMLSRVLVDNMPAVLEPKQRDVLGEPRLGEDGPWREPLDAAVNELSRDEGAVDWGWGSLKTAYVMATTRQGWVSFEGGQDGYAAYGKQHSQPNYSRLDSSAEVANALGVSPESAGRMVETIKPAVQKSYEIYVEQGDGPVLTTDQLTDMSAQVATQRVVGHELRTSIADQGAPRVGPAPATSVPSPGGAPRVGGHVQGRSHEQGPSVDR